MGSAGLFPKSFSRRLGAQWRDLTWPNSVVCYLTSPLILDPTYSTPFPLVREWYLALFPTNTVNCYRMIDLKIPGAESSLTLVFVGL
jgi:hypothetical protein